MTEIQIWTGAKWAVSILTGALSIVTIPATKNQLSAWVQKGWITFHDDPAVNPKSGDYNTQAEYFGGLIASWCAYLFTKTMAVHQTFPSFLMFSAIQVNILPAFYDYMRHNINVLLQTQMTKNMRTMIDVTVLSYCTFVSMFTSELSKFPLL
jgi:hypothetical protein